jgi:ELWxxDGT repeat protein
MLPFRAGALFSRCEVDTVGSSLVDEPWIADATTGEARLLRDIAVGSARSHPDFLFANEDLAYFVAKDETHEYNVWVTDGTEEGTVVFEGFYPPDGPVTVYRLVQLGNNLYYSSPSGLWVKSLERKGYSRQLLGPEFKTTILGAGSSQVFLVNFREKTGWELWTTDGTTEGTRMVKDIDGEPTTSLSPPWVVEGDNVYIVADDGVHGGELWRSDGTADGTWMVGDVWPGPRTSDPAELTAVGGSVWFTANDGVHGHEPWRNAGSPGGAEMIADIRPGHGPSVPRDYHVMPSGRRVLFIASDGLHGDELWLSNGTRSGTRLVEDVIPGPRSGAAAGFVTVGDHVYFAGRDWSAGEELWAIPISALEPQSGFVSPVGPHFRELNRPEGQVHDWTGQLTKQ